MKNFNIGMLAASLAFSAGVMAADAARDSSTSQDLNQSSAQSEDQIKSQYKADREVCNSMSGNTKDICVAEAKGREKVAKAELQARTKNTDKARYDVAVANAES